ncbi:hypothetical protein QTP88_025414 [Uroleucon formosanum]
MSREEDWIKISNEFNKIWKFSNCTGAIDGKHIAIQCPPCAGSKYFNYKGFHSIVLQAVVDAHAKFIKNDVGDYGRSSDSGIFKESNFGKMLLHNELNLPPLRKIHNDINEEYSFVFVGDEAYPLLPCLIRPFPRRNLTNEKLLENNILVGPEKATQIVKAICVLLNLIMTREQHCIDIQEFINSQEQNEIIEQDIIKIRSSNNRSSTVAISLQNKFTEYFNSNKEKHKEALKKLEAAKHNAVQPFIQQFCEYDFNADLCSTLVAANIPLNKLNNEHFRSFLSKYCNKTIPNESTLRKRYFDSCYTNTIAEIRDAVNGQIYGFA